MLEKERKNPAGNHSLCCGACAMRPRKADQYESFYCPVLCGRTQPGDPACDYYAGRDPRALKKIIESG